MSRNKVKIAGIGSFLPPKVTNEDLIERFGEVYKAASKLTDIKERSWSFNIKDTTLVYKNSDLATHAAVNALQNAELEAGQIDLIILSTWLPDHSLPPTVTFVQENLKMERAATIEIRSGCSGFGQGIATAIQYIKTRKYSNIIVIGSELNSACLPAFLSLSRNTLRDALTVMTFGDGAGAVVLQPSDDEENIIDVCLGTIGVNKKPGMILPRAFDLDFAERMKEGPLFPYDFTSTLQNLPILAEKAINHLLEETKFDIRQVSKIVIPVENKRIIYQFMKNNPNFFLGENDILTIASEVGHLVNAAIPVALVELNRRSKIKEGEYIILLTGENTKWTYGSILVKWPFLKKNE